MHTSVGTLVATMLWAAGAGAQTGTPVGTQRPVAIVAPYAAGGPVDIVARILARPLSTEWNRPVVVENRTGAGGNIGTEHVARSATDGNTLLLNTGALLVAPLVQAKAPVDPFRDLAPVTKVGYAPALLMVSAKSPFKSPADIVAFGKANPGKLSFGSPGHATTLQLCAELFKTLAGFDAVHVPFRGSAASVTALIGDQIHFHYDAMFAALPHARGGTLRAIAISTRTRAPQAPDVPTMVESGVPGYDAAIWFGLFAAAGTPAAITDRLAADVQKVLKDADVRRQLESNGFVIVGNSPRELTGEMEQEQRMWADVVKKTGVKVD